MRTSYAALVLATALIGHVAAGPLGHAHQRFHAKREAEIVVEEAQVERRALANVDWSKVIYTYSSGQTWGDATKVPDSPAPKPTTSATAAAVVPSTTAAPAPPAQTQAPTTGYSTKLTDADASKLKGMSVMTAVNSLTNNGGIWLAGDGPYTNEFTNNAGTGIILLIWGKAGSWVNANAPAIAVSLAPGQKTIVSFANGASGAWAGIYPNVNALQMGQVGDTWGEFTFSPDGVVDVSREVYMWGHNMSIQGPTCLSDMNTCVFKCPAGQDTCWKEYFLDNCDAKSNKGAQSGYDPVMQGASGGCGGLGNSAHLTTSLS